MPRSTEQNQKRSAVGLDVIPVPVFSCSTKFKKIWSSIADSDHVVFGLADEQEQLRGLFSVREAVDVYHRKHSFEYLKIKAAERTVRTINIEYAENYSNTAVYATHDLPFVATFKSNKFIGVLPLSVLTQNEILRLEERHSEQNELSIGAVHDLKTPLSVILMACQKMRQLFGAEEADSTMKMIQTSANRCLTLVHGLLEIQRQTLKGAIEIVPLVMIEFLEETTQELKWLAKEVKGIDLHIICASSFEAKVNASIISRIVQNLVDNSINCAKSATRIEVSADHISVEGKNYLKISVKDNGLGVEDRKDSGHGLGLAIVRKLSELHLGFVEFESPNVGTCVSVVIPIV